MVATASRRAVAIVATAGLLAVAALCFHLVSTSAVFADTEFSGAAFRAAAAAQDDGALRDQAEAAVESSALIGLSPANLRKTLGPPSKVSNRGHHYEWDAGKQRFLFTGTAQVQLYVELDTAGRRVEYAEMSVPQD